MSRADWSDRVPSRQESEERAADDRAARRERILDWITGLTVVLIVVGLAAAIGHLSGELP